MLILTRKPGETLYIGDDIKITIVEIKGHQIRLGIEAPREFRVYREEIYQAILDENKSAALSEKEVETEAVPDIVHPVVPRALSGFSVRRASIKPVKEDCTVSKEKSVDVVVRRKRPKMSDE